MKSSVIALMFPKSLTRMEPFCNPGLKKKAKISQGVTFIEQHHYFLEGLHEVNVVITILLNLQQKSQL